MKKIDLHVHSTYSDGTFSPAELVKEAVKNGISAFALTDHDTTDGIDEAIDAGGKAGIEVIPGIEISTSYKDKEIHIVGLFIDYKNKEFHDAIYEEIKRRDARNRLLIQKFNEAGFPVSLEVLENMFPHSIITRAHFASYMTKKGYVKDNKEAFSKYLGDGCPLYVSREHKSVYDAVDMIKKSRRCRNPCPSFTLPPYNGRIKGFMYKT